MRSQQPLTVLSAAILTVTLASTGLAACSEVHIIERGTPSTEAEPTEPTDPSDPARSKDGGGGGKATADAGAPGAPGAEAPPPPSCAPGGGAGTAKDCGSGASCCAHADVPGGTFFRWKNGAAPEPADDRPATVSAFSLDLFEVTVGRFRRFADAGFGTRQNPPPQGSGAHPKIPGSGWKSAWNALLPADRIALDREIVNAKPVTIWTQGAGPNETKPMKGVGYALAFAFCAWDGGRLPTVAEWNFAAAGGDEHRTFPWGNTIGKTRAVYDCRNVGEDQGCDPSDLPTVGSKPDGAGRWGHFDLVGSLTEWALDSDPDLMPCKDCGVVDPMGNWTVTMGGSFWSPEIGKVTAGAIVMHNEPTGDFENGVRCARDLGAVAK